MKPVDFFDFLEGSGKQLLQFHEIARRVAYFCVAPHVAKPITVGRFNADYWPLPNDVNADAERRQRLLNRLKQLQKNGERGVADRSQGEG